MTKPKAISVTPLSLDADSRTLRIAVSLARHGFRSGVLNGGCMGSFPEIEVDSIGAALPRQHGVSTRASRSRLVATLRNGRLGIPGEFVLFVAFALYHYAKYVFSTRIPPADLYYVHSYEYYAAVKRVANRCRAPIIYDAHDFYQGITAGADLSRFDRVWRLPFLRRIEARCITQAAAAVTVSPGVADLIEREYGRRPVVIRNLHDDRMDREPVQKLRERLGLTEESRLLVVIGNYKRGMAVDQLMAAMDQLPASVHLAFVGRGYDAVPELQGRPGDGRVHCNVAVSPQEVVPFIRSADVGLVIYRPYSQNYLHALPNGFFQVVAAGLPVIYPRLPEISAVVQTSGIGVCLDELTSPNIADAVMKVLSNTSQYAKASADLAAGMRWAEEEKLLFGLVDDVLRTY